MLRIYAVQNEREQTFTSLLSIRQVTIYVIRRGYVYSCMPQHPKSLQ